MASVTESSGDKDAFHGDDLRAIQVQLEALARMAREFPLECSLGPCDFLFESRDEIEILVESLTDEISASRNAA